MATQFSELLQADAARHGVLEHIDQQVAHYASALAEIGRYRARVALALSNNNWAEAAQQVDFLIHHLSVNVGNQRLDLLAKDMAKLHHAGILFPR